MSMRLIALIGIGFFVGLIAPNMVAVGFYGIGLLVGSFLCVPHVGEDK